MHPSTTMTDPSIDLPGTSATTAAPAPQPGSVGAAGPLSGRLAVVTGGSGRLGRSVALRLAVAGARVLA